MRLSTTLFALTAAIALAGSASAAPLVGTTVTGTISPSVQSGMGVPTQFTSPAMVGAGVEFTGALKDNSFGQDFGVSADLSDASLIVRFTSANANSNLGNTVYGLFTLNFGSAGSLFPGILDTTKTCASSANTICAERGFLPTVTSNGSTLSAAFNFINSGDVFTITFAPAAVAGVPEPTTWAMMIGGFGLVGASMRRRKVAVGFA